MVINLQKYDTWKIQLRAAINLVSSKDGEEQRVLLSTSDNIKLLSYDDANEVVDELFESLRARYQRLLETSMRGSDFIFDSV